MQEVYEELLGHMKDHPILGKYLQGHLPEWSDIFAEDTFDMLSTGEQVLVNIALALYNGHRAAAFADIFSVDRNNQRRILNALSLRIREVNG